MMVTPDAMLISVVKVALRLASPLLKLPFTSVGPVNPLPRSTKSFPCAPKPMSQGVPILQVALMRTPGSVILRPGKGT